MMAAIPIPSDPNTEVSAKRKPWFNWPLVLGLIVNFLILGLLGWVVGRGR
jgi:hypothetical protein